MSATLTDEQMAELVKVMRSYEEKSRMADGGHDLYYVGVAYGINHAVRVLYGTAEGDRMVSLAIKADRAEEKASAA